MLITWDDTDRYALIEKLERHFSTSRDSTKPMKHVPNSWNPIHLLKHNT